MLFRIPTLQRKFVCYFSAIISQANHMAGAVTPSLLRRMCSWSICRCNRVGAAGLTKIRNIYLNYWFLNNPHMQKSRCMCLSFDITGELKMAPKLAETTDELIFWNWSQSCKRTTKTRRMVDCCRNAKRMNSSADWIIQYWYLFRKLIIKRGRNLSYFFKRKTKNIIREY